MRRIIKWLIVLFCLYSAIVYFQQKQKDFSITNPLQQIQNEIDQDAIQFFFTGLNQGIEKLKDLFHNSQELLPDWEVKESAPDIEKPSLTPSEQQLFSIYNITIGEEKRAVEQQIPPFQRASQNEYGIEWYSYHENYQNFIMVGYDEQNKVAALYTNQDLISSKTGIKRGTKKEEVMNELGTPLQSIQKGWTSYKLPDDRDYEMFLIDDSYITIFFDKHEGNTVTALQIVSTTLEENKENFYTPENEDLKIGLEYQLFDLTNASRVNNGLNVLEWDDSIRVTARKHSVDMAENNYFSHTNLDGESPFDRMLADGIRYSMAGENLAYGQNSSIFAHEGLMNSLGHRENILQKGYTTLGIGVAFNTTEQPYYTENFISK